MFVKSFKPTSVLIFLLALSLGLYLTDLIFTYLGYRYFLWHSSKAFVDFHNIFSLLNELSIPTLFSTLNLLFSSILLWVIAKDAGKNNKDKKYYWLFLSVIFLFLSIDEGARVHETIGKFTNTIFNYPAGHPFYYSWVLPYAVFTVVTGFIYIKFLFELPRNIMIGIIASGLLFVTSALGIEVFEAMESGNINRLAFVQMYNFDKLTLIATFQELLEMIAISVFNFVLLKYIAMENIKIEFSVKS